MARTAFVTFTDYSDPDSDDGVEVQLPGKFELCPQCDGSGVSVSHVECDGGGFTSSEWAEQDDDFREGYLSGAYDRPCPCCNGLRVITVLDEDRCKPELLERYRAYQEEEADYRRECEMERRLGC